MPEQLLADYVKEQDLKIDTLICEFCDKCQSLDVCIKIQEQKAND